MAVEVLRRSVESVPGYQIAWIATNGAEAVAQCARDRPDLALMDLMMPVMDGVEATRRIMKESPCPILIVTGSIQTHTPHIFEALAAGALDVTRTPGPGDGARELLRKIDSLASLTRAATAARRAAVPAPAHDRHGLPLIAIGASAGGPAALAQVLSSIPSSIRAAIVIIQHIDARFAGGLAEWLASASTVPVRTASDGDKPAAGVALLAESDDHLALRTDGSLAYTREPVALSYRPSVDVFFDSAARSWRGPLVGVVLTGMGRDGTSGLQAIRDAGGTTIVQDRASSVVYGMPKAAIDAGVADEVLPLGAIGERIVALTNRRA